MLADERPSILQLSEHLQCILCRPDQRLIFRLSEMKTWHLICCREFPSQFPPDETNFISITLSAWITDSQSSPCADCQNATWSMVRAERSSNTFFRSISSVKTGTKLSAITERTAEGGAEQDGWSKIKICDQGSRLVGAIFIPVIAKGKQPVRMTGTKIIQRYHRKFLRKVRHIPQVTGGRGCITGQDHH